jgi:type I restriction-modification system DNA methylase subunit
MATGMSPLPNLAGLAPAQPLGGAGLIDAIATLRFQNASRNLPRHSAATPGLAPNGSMALLLANGSMSSNSSGEGDIRRALIEADLVECMVALPGQLFTNTQIPACIWFLTKNKAKRSRPGAAALRDRRGETLCINARKRGILIVAGMVNPFLN